MPSIKESVGRKGRNLPADVKVVQELLNKNIASLAPLRPLVVNGLADEALYGAIEEFQRKVMAAPAPDGKVDPKGRTLRFLARVVNPNLKGGPYFPLAKLPPSWSISGRNFGANRDGSTRAHAGCDLICAEGTLVYAVTKGTVQLRPYHFKSTTEALEVDHGSFVIRYGEIKAGCPLRQGDTVDPGEQIAEVGSLGMLHLEIYDKSKSGPLTQDNQKLSKKRKDGISFHRRLDLVDPDPRLTAWKSTLPTPY